MKNESRKMRIGILTFHRSINYGAFLQSYALSTNIQKSFPETQVEIIDYCPEFEIEKYNVSFKNFIFGSKYIKYSCFGVIKNIAKLILMPSVLKQKKEMSTSFEKSYRFLPLSKDRWITDDYKAFYEEIKGKYDILIVGSDAVWEYKVFPFPNAYFLSEELKAVKMSYAACSGRMNRASTTEEERKMLNSIWQHFDYIGVRDDATGDFIKSINDKLTSAHNCDPSFILDINNKQDTLFDRKRVEEILVSKGIDITKPIIGIMGGNNMGKMIREFWGDKYQIVAVYYPNRYADVYLSELTPFEWAVVFSYFKITFTRFFHGTIFSLKNGTPTISIDDWNESNGQLSKLHDVLIRTNLENHYFRVEQMQTEDGKQRIKESAEEFINNPDTQRIADGLHKEMTAFADFEKVLKEQIEKVSALKFSEEG